MDPRWGLFLFGSHIYINPVSDVAVLKSWNSQAVPYVPENSLVALVEKTLPAYAGDMSSILGQEDPLEKEMATHSSILAWRILWTEGPARLQSMGSQARYDLSTKRQQ